MSNEPTYLLPCPFCGCTKSPVLQGNGIGDNWLECTDCGASTRMREDGAGSTKDWNRRPTPLADAAAIAEREAFEPVISNALHPDTAKLVRRFARALANKLLAAQRKYGYSNNWLRDDWMDECRAELRRHIEKGDPRDVAAYCAFLWHHGASTRAALATTKAPMTDAIAPTEGAVCRVCNGHGYRTAMSATGEGAFNETCVYCGGAGKVALSAPSPEAPAVDALTTGAVYQQCVDPIGGRWVDVSLETYNMLGCNNRVLYAHSASEPKARTLTDEQRTAIKCGAAAIRKVGGFDCFAETLDELLADRGSEGK